jgi:enoyl-CoA hydratase
MTDSPLLTSEDGGVLTITINRPEARNAVNAGVATGMAEALDRLDADDNLRIGIITGAGQTFCAGMDLKALLQGENAFVAGRGFGGIAQRAAAKPLIAAVEGYALAGGFEIALCCDMIVASREARFGIPEVKRGLVAAAGGLFRLPQRIPYHLAMEFALTGDPIDASRAADLGIVNRVVEPGQALAAAGELAAAIVRNAPLALTASKAVVQRAREWTEAEAWDAQMALMAPVFGSEDMREGARAFAEKRDPLWQGR